MRRFRQMIPRCKVLNHPRASHTYTVTPLVNISTQGRHAWKIPEARVGWRGGRIAPTLQGLRALCERFPPALIHPRLSARKTGIKRRKVNMEEIQGREGTLG